MILTEQEILEITPLKYNIETKEWCNITIKLTHEPEMIISPSLIELKIKQGNYLVYVESLFFYINDNTLLIKPKRCQLLDK